MRHSTLTGLRLLASPVPDAGATPLGLALVACFPGVARASQPRAGGRNPVGIWNWARNIRGYAHAHEWLLAQFQIHLHAPNGSWPNFQSTRWDCLEQGPIYASARADLN